MTKRHRTQTFNPAKQMQDITKLTMNMAVFNLTTAMALELIKKP